MITPDKSQHPEARQGELFITNMSSGQFARFAWLSKRQGTVAYDGYGRALNAPDWFPVFVSAAELADRGESVRSVRKFWRTVADQSTAA